MKKSAVAAALALVALAGNAAAGQQSSFSVPEYKYSGPLPVQTIVLPKWTPVIPASCSIPSAQIIASHRIVYIDEPFDIRVIAKAPAGLDDVWWQGVNTGIAALDAPHRLDMNGETTLDRAWPNIVLGREGIFTFTADCRDKRFAADPNWPHQASATGEIATCVVEARRNFSYSGQVDLYKERYGMSDEWAAWMKRPAALRTNAAIWERCRLLPTTIRFAFRYGERVAYDPRWRGEWEHMDALREMAELSFPGMHFDFLYNADPRTTDFRLQVRGDGDVSYYETGLIYLYREGIFPEECGHAFYLPHQHVEEEPDRPINLPPGENGCVMARNSNGFCSFCRTVMNIPLDADTGDEAAAAIHDLNARYPD